MTDELPLGDMPAALAREFAGWVDASPLFVRMAPVPSSTVCFRLAPRGKSDEEADALNERLMHAVNATGEVYLSHTRLQGRITLCLAIGNLRTTEDQVARAWTIVQREAWRLVPPGPVLSPDPARRPDRNW